MAEPSFNSYLEQEAAALLLAGGRSRRMGCDKKSLTISGSRFQDLIAEQLSIFPKRFFSVRTPEELSPPGFQLLPDNFPDCGPLGGLCTGLQVCPLPYLFVVACDMPLFHHDLARYLACFLSSEFDAFLPIDRAGRIHPLCGFYRKSALPALENQLHRGRYRFMDALKQLRVKYIPMEHSAYPDSMLSNINTQEDYQRLLQQTPQPPVLAVCGIKNSGKTTFLCRLIPALQSLGIRVAAIKHDGHEFQPDRPGTDSFRLLQAGAQGVIIYSRSQYQLVCRQKESQISQLTSFFPDVDLILLEGGRHSPYPKIEVVRSAASLRPTIHDETLLAVCTDLNAPDWGIPILSPDQPEVAATWIVHWMASLKEGFQP